MKIKINWKDERFKGLTKKQIKKLCTQEAQGKPIKIPKPELTKRMKKKIQKMKFLEEVKSKGTDSKGKKTTTGASTTAPGLSCNEPTENAKETDKRELLLQKAKDSPCIFVDASFEAKHNKHVQSTEPDRVGQ